MATMKPLLFAAALGWLTAGEAWAADVNSGGRIYRQHCAMCHGVDGSPVMAGAADFARGDGLMRSDRTLVERIRDGRRACPAYRGILDDEEILDVIAHIRTLF